MPPMSLRELERVQELESAVGSFIDEMQKALAVDGDQFDEFNKAFEEIAKLKGIEIDDSFDGYNLNGLSAEAFEIYNGLSSIFKTLHSAEQDFQSNLTPLQGFREMIAPGSVSRGEVELDNPSFSPDVDFIARDRMAEESILPEQYEGFLRGPTRPPERNSSSFVSQVTNPQPPVDPDDTTVADDPDNPDLTSPISELSDSLTNLIDTLRETFSLTVQSGDGGDGDDGNDGTTGADDSGSTSGDNRKTQSGVGNTGDFDILAGIALGLRQIFKDVAKPLFMAGKMIKGVLGKGLKDLMSKIKGAFSLDKFGEANESKNLEKYLQAQSTNLLRMSKSEAQAYASSQMKTIEAAAAEFGLTRSEMTDVARSMSQIIPAIPEKMGMSQSELGMLLARSQATVSDLGGGSGMKVSDIVSKINSNGLTNDFVAQNFDDAVLSRMQDASKGRSITGNPVADMQNLLEVLAELDAEVDLGDLTKTNPARILRSFEAKLFNPNTGMFGFLRDFSLSDSLQGGAMVDSNLLDQMSNLLTIGLEKIGEFLTGLVASFSGVTAQSPLQALGILMNRLAAFIQAIDIEAILSTVQGFTDKLFELFTLENLNKVGAQLDKIGQFIGSWGKKLKENGLLMNAIIYALIAKFGGLTGLGAKAGYDLTGGNKWGALAGGVAAPVIGIGIREMIRGALFSGGKGIFAALSGGGAAAGAGASAGAGAAASGGMLSGLFAAMGGLLAPLLPILGLLAAVLAGLALGVGVAMLAMKLMGHDMGQVMRDMKDGAKMASKAMINGAKTFAEWATFGLYKNETNDDPLADSNLSAEDKIETTDGIATESSLDSLFGGDEDSVEVSNNFGGDIEASTQLIKNISQALAIEDNRNTAGGKVELSAINSSESVFNKDQLDSIPGAVADIASTSNSSTLANTTAVGGSLSNVASISQGLRDMDTTGSQAARSLSTLGSNSSTANTSSSTNNFSPTINVYPGENSNSEEIANMVLSKISDAYAQESSRYFS